AAVGCVLTDGATGWQHKQVRLLYPRKPYAFFFDTLEESRHYSIFLEGVDNGDARTGAFTTLKAWPDRREPPALRAAARLSGNGGDDDDYDQSQSCDVRLLFVSGTGLTNAARVELRDEGDGGASTTTAGEATAADMWGVLGRELWRPWPQADVVVHTGSQVDLEVAVMEVLPILSVAEAEEEGSEEREQAEEMAMERIRDAYRFQWSLPGARACLSCGSHVMVRGEADLALPQLDGSSRRSSSSTTSSAAGGVGVSAGRGRRSGGGGGGETLAAGKGGGQGGGLLGLQVSAYARITLARLASQAFDDYQRQLWDPLSVPMGHDMNDVGYARGGPGIDSEGSGDGFFRNAASVGGEGEWHFHVYGETVGLFALDVRQGSAGLQRDERAPLLSDTQWSSLARALSIEEIQAMVVVGDAPFVSDSILDARAKARHPSHAHLRRSWPFHGGELLRLVGMLVEWKTAGAVGGEPREVVTLIGGGVQYPLETAIKDSSSSVAITQTVCGPFYGIPSLHGRVFEPAGALSQRFSYHHTINDPRDEGGRGQQQEEPGGVLPASAGSDYKVMPPPRPLSSTSDRHGENGSIENGALVPEIDSPYRSPSCVLVRCEARGAGPSARLLLRNRFFTASSWAAWCSHGDAGAAAKSAIPPPPLPLSTETNAPPSSEPPSDTGRPRAAPRWAATAWQEQAETISKKQAGGGGRGATEAADALSALCADESLSDILLEAFDRVLDINEGEDEDEALAAARAGTGDATRRVFESLDWVYNNAACARVRALYPTRPSPIVVHHLLKPAQHKGSGSSITADESKVPPRPAKARESAETAIAKGRQGRSGQRGGGEGKRPKRSKTRDEGAKEGEARSLLPSWLFVHLPFHDDESFAEFFCEVLRGSERLAAGFV
ncbi:unnamed protein product, partial [Ectocarpus sp. 13 AM-2016]